MPCAKCQVIIYLVDLNISHRLPSLIRNNSRVQIVNQSARSHLGPAFFADMERTPWWELEIGNKHPHTHRFKIIFFWDIGIIEWPNYVKNSNKKHRITNYILFFFLLIKLVENALNMYTCLGICKLITCVLWR